jgi:3'-phosphoadenosine 5'-phosphosulfate sulfotransferase (PAPS reductase)/FAD synthetase
MTTVIRNQGTSVEVRAKLKAESRPVLLAFSCGKDSIATWLALEDAGIEVVPAYLYYVPGLRFVDDELEYFESKFGQRIHRYPHPSLYRWINSAVFQAPERLRVVEAAKLPTPSYDQMWDLIRDDLGLPKDTWVADGVRAADSIQRRGAFTQYGYFRKRLKKVSPIGDWLKAETLDCISSHGVDLPIDYEWFGRSFDGLDRRFTAVLKEKAPDDFAVLKSWFPLLEVDHVR